MKIFAITLFFCLSIQCVSAQIFALNMDVENPPEGILFEEWAEMLINGEKVGYSHSLLERRGEFILSHEESYMRIGRGPTSISTINTSKTRERIDGTPVSLSVVTREGMRTMTKSFQFNSEGVSISTNDGVRSWTKEVPLEPGFVLDWSFVRELAQVNPAIGETFTSQVYLPEIVSDRTLPVTTTFAGKEPMTLNGETFEAWRIEQTLQLGFLPLNLTAWVRENGKLLRMNMPLGGMNITMIGTTEEKAKATFSPPDLFTDSLIPLNRKIPDDAREVTFNLRSNGDLAEKIPTSAYQSVRMIDDRSVEILVRRGSLRSVEAGPTDEVYLNPSPLVDYEDPAISNLVAEAGIEELSWNEKVRTLVQIADNAITVKSMDLGFATASETLALQEGDCTEHALLLAALCRSAGIPSRGASGVVYFLSPEGDPVMGYHMWTQVWNGEEWLDVDAAFGTAEPAPIRILFSTSDLMDPALTEEILLIAQHLGQTQVKVTSVTNSRRSK